MQCKTGAALASHVGMHRKAEELGLISSSSLSALTLAQLSVPSTAAGAAQTSPKMCRPHSYTGFEHGCNTPGSVAGGELNFPLTPQPASAVASRPPFAPANMTGCANPANPSALVPCPSTSTSSVTGLQCVVQVPAPVGGAVQNGLMECSECGRKFARVGYSRAP